MCVLHTTQSKDLYIIKCLHPFLVKDFKAKIFALGEWYSCRGLAVVANSGVLTLGFKTSAGL